MVHKVRRKFYSTESPRSTMEITGRCQSRRYCDCRRSARPPSSSSPEFLCMSFRSAPRDPPASPPRATRARSTRGATRGPPQLDVCELRLQVRDYKFTSHFEPYIKKAWCIYVMENAIRSERQEGNRYRFWAAIAELGGRYLRAVTLADRVTIHNAFPDRDFEP